MDRDRLGLVGRLTADRPFLLSLVIAIGLTALAVAGVQNAQRPEYDARLLGETIAAFLLMPVLPLGVAAAAPRSLTGRIAILFVLFVLVAALRFIVPAINPDLPLPDDRVILPIAASCGLYLAFAHRFGAAARFTFVSALAGVLGVSAAMGLGVLNGVTDATVIMLGTVALAFAVIVGSNLSAEFAAYFAAGADSPTAAGAAARQTFPCVVFTGVVSAVAFAMVRSDTDFSGMFQPAWLAAAGAALAAGFALFATAGALALQGFGEKLAVAENRRSQELRRFWRPLRNTLRPNAAYAFVAIAGIAIIAIAFNANTAPDGADYLFIAAGGMGATLIFMSLRTGLFVFAALLAAVAASAALTGLTGAAPLEEPHRLAGLAVSAALIALLGAAWRDARSPYRNARETTEAALADASGRYAVALLGSFSALCGAELSGGWERAGEVASQLIVHGAVAALIAPALMTALGASSRRGDV